MLFPIPTVLRKCAIRPTVSQPILKTSDHKTEPAEMCLALASNISISQNEMKRTLDSSSLSLTAGCDPSGSGAVAGFALSPPVVSLAARLSGGTLMTHVCLPDIDDACSLLSLCHFCTNTNNSVRI